MKKTLSLLWVLGGLLFAVSCHSGEQSQEKNENDSTVVKLQTNISDTLAAKMDHLLNNYYHLKDAFVQTDSVAADAAAKNLNQSVEVISLSELKQDATKYDPAHASLESLKGEIAGLLGEKTMEGKRMEFQMISDITYDLIKTVGLKKETVYHTYCPMALDDKGAYWLSDSKTIRNPYFGNKMINCGEVKETLQF